MALIEEFHVVADHFPVAAHEEIIEGMLVTLNPAGDVILAAGASGEVCLGVAGDTKSVSQVGLPTTNASNQGAFVNRVSDSFDETKASGRMTVYHSGGKFATNQYETGSYAVNDPLYVSGNGKFTSTPSASLQIVAYVTKVPAAWDSGVPGLDATGDLQSVSMSLGNYLEFKLVI